MKIIIPTTSTFEQVVGRQKRADGERYRLMTYVVQQPVDDGLLLYNTLTCSMVLLTPDEIADLTAQGELIDRWFLVSQEHDDRKLRRQVRQMAALLTPAPKVVTTYTILTTTGCNARCFYCYEQGTKPATMTAETASRVVRYIMAHRGGEEVTLRWFGGEPLVNAKAIDQISTELKEQGVPFRSKMITNGYLMDADLVERAKELWQLQWVQITLDGMAQTYNRVKYYIYQGVNAFEHVLENISERSAEWYFLSAAANMGLGNRVAAMNYAETAVSMEPNNFEYRQLLNNLQGGGQFYQTQGFERGFGTPAVCCGDPVSCCMSQLLINMLCNCCCGCGRGC